ncbi:MAG TPA: radical SAM family heme chaperone HemW [Candidatus Aminicenantes bacterium]|nr:radical SAM family heme chaperone HemW [Candidatus Aminicenantes bacterium]
MIPPDHSPFPANNREIGLYLHFPFCRRHCRYCHFTTTRYRSADADDYLKLLFREIELSAHRELLIRTVYLGGGSPSLLSSPQLETLIKTLRRHFHSFVPEEVTIEANPDDLSPEWLRAAVHNGFNRISIGVQSLDSRVLRRLGRNHAADTGLKSISRAADAGFVNINVDFMIGVPGQTATGIARQVCALKELPVTHLSIYMLEQTPEDTRSRAKSGQQIYVAARDAAEDVGYRRYEVSSFARPGAECRHNLTYWRNREYMGIGLSAAGFLDGVDICNTRNMPRYIRGIQAGRPVRTRRRISVWQRSLITGLRLAEGVPVSTLQSRLNDLQPLLEANILLIHQGRLAVAPDHFLMLNEILGRYVL